MSRRKKKIGQKVNRLLLCMTTVTMLLSGGVSFYSLYSMKEISSESSRELGQTAAEDAEKALEQMAAEHLTDIAMEKAAYIEEKYKAVESYVLGIASQAQKIYESPDSFPNRSVALPVPDSTELAAQRLQSERLKNPSTQERKELLKLGNIQDMMVQYNANDPMVSSVYLATESGWMIQADYIAFSKYEDGAEDPLPYEASERQWYQRAVKVAAGEVIYTDVISDIHEGGDCIICASPVYYGGEVVAVAGVGSYLETVNNAVLSTVIGEGGYAFLVNEKGQVMISGIAEGETAACGDREIDLRDSKNIALAEAVIQMVQGETGSLELTLNGEEVYLAYAPLPRLGWSFVTVMNAAEVIAPARESHRGILELTEQVEIRQGEAIGWMFLLFVYLYVAAALFILGFGTLFSRRITGPIRLLTSEVAKIDGGNLDYRICLRTRDELETLGDTFNKMAEQIQQYVKNLASVTAEKERIRTEIQVASRLQADMLPEVEGAFADRKEFALSAFMAPAKGVGGDFYDFFLLDEDHLALVMADVSGKGVPAALFMVVSRTMIRSHIISGESLAQSVEEINNSLCRNNKNGMFVTAWLGVLTLSTGELEFVNAGHCRPLILHNEGLGEYNSERGGFVLAGVEDSDYRSFHLQLSQGDTLLLYTDGVTEATSKMEELYGEERLLQMVESCAGKVPRTLIQSVWEDVQCFQAGTEQFDDVTMLALAYYGKDYREKTGKPFINNIGEYMLFLEETLEKRNISKKVIVELQLAVDEIYSNICYYSGAKEVSMGIRIMGENRKVMLIFEDDGIPYNPIEKTDPEVNAPMREREVGGLGIYLVKNRMDRVAYEYIDGKNRLTLVKNEI